MIMHEYEFSDVSLFLLTNYISLSAMDRNGVYVQRQCTIPPMNINLECLKQLNRLSYEVVRKRPSSECLEEMLQKQSAVHERPEWQILLAQTGALGCLCFIFGGGLRDVIAVIIVTVILHYVMSLSSKLGLDAVAVNALNMFISTIAAVIIVHLGISSNMAVILITVSMLVIPGIPLVNAVRNLICGNEMNGILQLAKVVIETMAMGAGIIFALWICGISVETEDAVVTAMGNSWLLVPISFFASVFFGVVFRIQDHDLFLAGLGGALTRTVLILLSSRIPQGIIYTMLAALAAALYGEFLATKRRDPSTYFIYPAIVPLIPGNLFYYALVAVYLGDRSMALSNASECMITLLGMSIGFVLSSIIAHYIRLLKHASAIKQKQ